MKNSIYYVNLEPAVGAEMNKTRPCLVVSPDEMNNHLRTIQVSPITSTFRNIPTRVLIEANDISGLKNNSYVVLDQIKTIDKRRLGDKLGEISVQEAMQVADVLTTMFQF